MKNILKHLKKYWPFLVLLAVWIPITYYNTKIYWMLVDDGYDVVFSRKLFESLSHLNIFGFVSQIFESGGRFRPVYWIYQLLEWLIGRNSFQIHHLVHMVVIGLTVYFLYQILSKLTKSKIFSLFGALTYLLIPINSENIIRLGPQEPLVALFLSIYFYLLIEDKHKILPIVFLFLSVFTKETVVAILPIVILYYLLSTGDKTLKTKIPPIYSLVSVFVFSLLLTAVTTMNRSGYSTNYIFEANVIFHNLSVFIREISLHTFYLFPLVSLIYLGKLVVRCFKKQKIFEDKFDLFEAIFFLGFVAFIVIQLPWKFDLTRYLMPSMLFLITFVFIEIHNILEKMRKTRFISNHERILKIAAIVASVYAFSVWGITLLSKEMNFISYKSLISRLAKLPKDSIILVNTFEGPASEEIVSEISIHLSEFWDRKDIRVQYLDISRLPPTNYVVLYTNRIPPKYSEQELTGVFGDKLDAIENSSREVVITTPLELIKKASVKTIKLIIKGEPFTAEGIYTFYYNNTYWNIYRQI